MGWEREISFLSIRCFNSFECKYFFPNLYCYCYLSGTVTKCLFHSFFWSQVHMSKCLLALKLQFHMSVRPEPCMAHYCHWCGTHVFVNGWLRGKLWSGEYGEFLGVSCYWSSAVDNNDNPAQFCISLFIFIPLNLKAAVLVSSRQNFCIRLGNNKKKKTGKSVVVAD